MHESILALWVRGLLGGVLAALLVLTGGCSPSAVTKTERDITVVFEGFVYVGNRSLGSGQEHSTRSSAIPSRFASGQEYLFHHSLPVDAMTMAVQTLPSRLRSIGFTVTSAPDTGGRGVFVPSDGDPMYMLKAVRGGCSLEIDHQPDKRLATKALPWEKDRWEYSDYVLKLDGSCSL